jgi:ABC-type siderophore export system fused ATPase/permease subunit
VGKIEYLYNQSSYRVGRVNFSIIELKSGTIVVSIGSSAQGFGNSDMARLIVKELETAIGYLK